MRSWCIDGRKRQRSPRARLCFRPGVVTAGCHRRRSPLPPVAVASGCCCRYVYLYLLRPLRVSPLPRQVRVSTTVPAGVPQQPDHVCSAAPSAQRRKTDCTWRDTALPSALPSFLALVLEMKTSHQPHNHIRRWWHHYSLLTAAAAAPAPPTPRRRPVPPPSHHSVVPERKRLPEQPKPEQRVREQQRG